MTPAFALSCVAILLATAVIAVAMARRTEATPVVYGLCLAVSLVLLTGALAELVGGGLGDALTLPLGVPWVGAHFRIDPTLLEE